MKKEKLTCEKARNMSILDTMAKLGLFPIRETEKEAWFLSPFRSETQASFKLSLKLNRWYDHGEGVGGNIIDLIVKLNDWSVKNALDYLNGCKSSVSFQKQRIKSNQNDTASYEIISVKNLENIALIDYLISRGVQKEAAQIYCVEVHYKMNNKNYFAIGFKNDENGFELRNKYFKGCIGKKAITSLKNGNNKVCVFEGFIDFLSYKTLYVNDFFNQDYIICNSTSLVKTLLPKLQKYREVYLCLDNDESGEKATKFLKQNHKSIMDCSIAYVGYKDMNDYLRLNVSKR